MDRETAKEKIKTGVSCTEFLEKSQGGLYCCPFPDCNSGHGENKTGAVKYYKDTNKFYCHACQRGGDVITLYQQTTGADYNEAVSLLAQRIGITVDPYKVPTSGEPAGNGAEAPQKPQTGAESTGREEAPAAEETAELPPPGSGMPGTAPAGKNARQSARFDGSARHLTSGKSSASSRPKTRPRRKSGTSSWS